DQNEGIFRLLMSDYVESINIGNPDETTILESAEEIIKLTGTDQKIILKPLPQNDPLQPKPDITRAKEHLVWEHMVHGSEGLKKVYDYFKSLPHDQLWEAHRDFLP